MHCTIVALVTDEVSTTFSTSFWTAFVRPVTPCPLAWSS